VTPCGLACSYQRTSYISPTYSGFKALKPIIEDFQLFNDGGRCLEQPSGNIAMTQGQGNNTTTDRPGSVDFGE
jgi:hypothetical protein